jgi:predicted DNA binding CopG/RHH family protein
MKKPIPRFESEEAERKFWARRDSTQHVDWSKASRAVFPNLRPSTRTISLRLPESTLEALKVLARKKDVGYQSLLKVFLAERIERELADHWPGMRRRRGRRAPGGKLIAAGTR